MPKKRKKPYWWGWVESQLLQQKNSLHWKNSPGEKPPQTQRLWKLTKMSTFIPFPYTSKRLVTGRLTFSDIFCKERTFWGIQWLSVKLKWGRMDVFRFFDPQSILEVLTPPRHQLNGQLSKAEFAFHPHLISKSWHPWKRCILIHIVS